MAMERIKQSPPWVEYSSKLIAMFGDDPEINVVYSNDGPVVSLYVDNQEKADAISQLLPEEVSFGNVTLLVKIIPSNNGMTKAQLFKTAFSGNPVFVNAVQIEGVFTNPLTYVVFKREVVQFFNDNLGDINGNKTTLYQDIAEEIFNKQESVFYCTDAEED